MTPGWLYTTVSFLLDAILSLKSLTHPAKETMPELYQLYLDSQKWNNCSMIDNHKSRETILLIKSWNIRQDVKHRYVLHPNNSCLFFKSVCILNDSGKIVSICQNKFSVLIPMLSANTAGISEKPRSQRTILFRLTSSLSLDSVPRFWTYQIQNFTTSRNRL